MRRLFQREAVTSVVSFQVAQSIANKLGGVRYGGDEFERNSRASNLELALKAVGTVR